jgi:transposase
MRVSVHSPAIRTDLGAVLVSLELSRSAWLITSLSPGTGEKMSKHAVRGGDIAALLTRLSEIKEKARRRTGKDSPIIAIQEAGLDVSGSTGCCSKRASKATSSTQPPS